MTPILPWKAPEGERRNMLALVLVRAGEGYTEEGTGDADGRRSGEPREADRWDQSLLSYFKIPGPMRYSSFSGAG